jgi:leader peptidase (prepilin peptidase)/N-methyltransferase
MIINLIVFLIGLVFGSFLNVLIHRLPLSISLVKPLGSACPNCSYGIKWYENIPVVSYLFLKGKCSNCSESISIVYPFVELITAVVTLVIYTNFLLNWEFLAIIALFYTLIVLSFIDLKYREVPDYLLIIVVALTLIVGDLINLLIFTGGLFLLELAITFYIQNIKAKITKNKGNMHICKRFDLVA